VTAERAQGEFLSPFHLVRRHIRFDERSAPAHVNEADRNLRRLANVFREVVPDRRDRAFLVVALVATAFEIRS
jgi:hypothetical protein